MSNNFIDFEIGFNNDKLIKRETKELFCNLWIDLLYKISKKFTAYKIISLYFYKLIGTKNHFIDSLKFLWNKKKMMNKIIKNDLKDKKNYEKNVLDDLIYLLFYIQWKKINIIYCIFMNLQISKYSKYLLFTIFLNFKYIENNY